MKFPLPPQTEAELLARAKAIEGLSLEQLATSFNQSVPTNLQRDKGWMGLLLEAALGATAATLSEPDFQLLGIELKTIPVNIDNKPQESTYICMVSIPDLVGQTWKTSPVQRKLARILWIPTILAGNTVGERRIGKPLLWSPTLEQEQILQQDWEELVEMIALGNIESITAHHGVYLQIRPKAANSRVLCNATGIEGERVRVNPRGFYLRATFTASLLNDGQ